MSEYIGSRISLISKSDIKYVGTLTSIDSDTATVSLKDVQCYGSEGRKGDPAQEVAATDTIYEGIVFRGSDVKDLTILSAPKENRPPQMPNDPAILGSSEAAASQQQHQPQHQQQPPPPHQQQQQNQYRGPQPPYGPPSGHFGYQGQPPNQFQQPPPRFQGPGGPHGFPGQPGAVPGYGMPPPNGMGFGPPPGYGGMGMGYGPPPGPGFPPGPPGQFPPHQQHMGPPGHPMNQHHPPQNMPGQQPIGSKQNTPQPGDAPGLQPPVQAQQTKPAEMSGTPAPAPSASAAPPPPIESKPSPAAAAAPPAPSRAQQSTASKPARKTNNRVAIPLAASPAATKSQSKPVTSGQPVVPLGHSPQNPAQATEAATAAVAAAMAKLGATNQQNDAAVENLSQKVNQMRVQDRSIRGPGRGRGGPRGGRRESTQKSVDVPKEDYDFEGANAKFNKQELVKEAIASGSPLTSPTNGNAPDPLASATNGHTDGADDVVIPPKEKGYDKKSSFFDNISSDLKDRTEQKQDFVDGRHMRYQERSKNMETFGQGSVDGGYRGRGRGRGRGGFSRGRGVGGGGYYGGGRGGFEHAARGGPRGGGARGADAAAA